MFVEPGANESSKEIGGSVALIFDFDGVIIDSETVSLTHLRDILRDDLRLSMSLDETMALFLGRRWAESAALISEMTRRPVPAYLHRHWIQGIISDGRSSMNLVSGAEAFLRATARHPRCIASSSSPEWISHWVSYFNLDQMFGHNILSARDVSAPKPNPEILLTAMKQLNVSAEHSILIDDSPLGIEAGRRAGVRTIGLCAGSHMRISHNLTSLEEANPTFLANSYSDILAYLNANYQNP